MYVVQEKKGKHNKERYSTVLYIVATLSIHLSTGRRQLANSHLSWMLFLKCLSGWFWFPFSCCSFESFLCCDQFERRIIHHVAPIPWRLSSFWAQEDTLRKCYTCWRISIPKNMLLSSTLSPKRIPPACVEWGHSEVDNPTRVITFREVEKWDRVMFHRLPRLSGPFFMRLGLFLEYVHSCSSATDQGLVCRLPSSLCSFGY